MGLGPGIRKKTNPDPGYRVKKAPDTASGSALLQADRCPGARKETRPKLSKSQCSFMAQDGVPVGDLAGLPNEGAVHQVLARHLRTITFKNIIKSTLTSYNVPVLNIIKNQYLHIARVLQLPVRANK